VLRAVDHKAASPVQLPKKALASVGTQPVLAAPQIGAAAPRLERTAGSPLQGCVGETFLREDKPIALKR
jgi:hypothetical protein